MAIVGGGGQPGRPHCKGSAMQPTYRREKVRVGVLAALEAPRAATRTHGAGLLGRLRSWRLVATLLVLVLLVVAAVAVSERCLRWWPRSELVRGAVWCRRGRRGKY